MLVNNKDLYTQAKNIQWIEFETNNICQYSKQHSWCPLHYDTREPIFLKTEIIHKVIQFFKRYDFSGRIYFSGYNEPTTDPRLIELLRYTKLHLPKCNIDMFSNGISLDENIISEMFSAGLNTLRLSIYSPKEHERFNKIYSKVNNGIIYFHPRYDKKVTDDTAGEDMDGRIEVYNNFGKGLIEPCFMPNLYYFVRNNGDVNLCFWDWKYTQIFGNLYNNSIEETLLNTNRLNIIDKLINNKRKEIPVCSGCKLPTNRCISEYCNRLKLNEI